MMYVLKAFNLSMIINGRRFLSGFIFTNSNMPLSEKPPNDNDL